MHLAQGGLFSNGANQYIIEKKIDNHVTHVYILMIPNNSFSLIPTLPFQSVANNFSDEWMRIWILFAKDILYEYEYEFYSWHLGSQIWIRILFVKDINEYNQIFKYIRIFWNNQTPRLLLTTILNIVVKISKPCCNFPYCWLGKIIA